MAANNENVRRLVQLDSPVVATRGQKLRQSASFVCNGKYHACFTIYQIKIGARYGLSVKDFTLTVSFYPTRITHQHSYKDEVSKTNFPFMYYGSGGVS